MRHPGRLASGIPAVGLALAVLVAACGPSAGPRPAPSEGQLGTIAEAAWATTPLTDARSGEAFRLADFAGSVVVVEPMAAWCINCLAQQREAQVALERLRGEVPVVYVSLGVDPGEGPEDLAAYSEREGFHWRFAVAGPEVARALADAFGPIFLSPPSTPLVVVDPTGQIVFADVGRHSASALESLIREAHQ
ncbi:MAG TPA: hypothetical protein VNO86_00365 [Candidatus Binatia bacterium]|nr:hypothetical protein [Candidatus Binatia bacterium]